MATRSKIEWTQMTWNPVTGCSKVSAGCKNCYAERMAKRLQAMGQKRYLNGFEVTLHEDLVELPYTWKTPRLVFVNSMSDLFHEKVPLEFIQRIFTVMEKCPQHTFQVLTKRSGRLIEVSAQLSWSPNIWMGVSVEDEHAMYRINDLQNTPAAIRFLSCEPLLGPLDNLDLTNIQWVIVGGESGPGARPMRLEWVESIYLQCTQARVSFFFKQWGGVHKKRNGRELHGRLYNEMPRPSNYGIQAVFEGVNTYKIVDKAIQDQ
ncbi:MAG: phage Gp37/Gp68 family protein [Anaerolineales bacterium]|jgi:protein gp37|nr:phage Gp37/Gp68 family protein [Anaerolineales bacterium]